MSSTAAIDRRVLGVDGGFALPFNTDGMFRDWIDADAQPHVAIWREE